VHYQLSPLNFTQECIRHVTNELHSQAILDNFYCSCAETTICQCLVKKFDPKFELAMLDVSVDVKMFQFDRHLRPLWPFIYHTCAENSHFTSSGLKLTPKLSSPCRFLIGPNVLVIAPSLQSLLVNFLLHRNDHISISG